VICLLCYFILQKNSYDSKYIVNSLDFGQEGLKISIFFPKFLILLNTFIFLQVKEEEVLLEKDAEPSDDDAELFDDYAESLNISRLMMIISAV